jgi:hypothetical protein
MTSIQNWNDDDPVSLEPIRTLQTWFELEFQNKTYRYDAWAWLEMFAREEKDRYVHPVFGSHISVQTRTRCWEACAKASAKTGAKASAKTGAKASAKAGAKAGAKAEPEAKEQRALLKQCESLRVRHTDFRDKDGHLCKLHLFVESPLYDIEIDADSSWCRWGGHPKPEWARGFRCEAAIKLSLVDAQDRVVAHRKIYM